MHRSNSTRRPTAERAYVLVATLVLLALVAMAMVAAARLSLMQATQATEAERNFSRRWVALSARRAILPQAESLLRTAEVDTRNPISSLRRTLRINGESFEFIVGDEQAKPHVGTLLRSRGEATATQGLRVSLGPASLSRRIRLRPVRIGNGRESRVTVESYADVCDGITPAQLWSSEIDPPLAERLTCWGSGGLHVQRASDQSLRLLCSPPLSLSHIAKLKKLRKASAEPLKVAELLAKLDLPDSDAEGLRPLLADRSNCYSLWVIAGEGKARQFSLAVQEIDSQRDTLNPPTVFEW